MFFDDYCINIVLVDVNFIIIEKCYVILLLVILVWDRV